MHASQKYSDFATRHQVFVTSKLDYCIHVGTKTYKKNLNLSKDSTPSSCKADYQEHITFMLCSLCWLPAEYGVKFKVWVLIFKALCGRGPCYLRNCLILLHDHDLSRHLQISGTMKLSSTRVRLVSKRRQEFSQQLSTIVDLTSEKLQ